jgi:mannose/fructose/N-acetylgalactosamine-specific phosphotransferase system component IIB
MKRSGFPGWVRIDDRLIHGQVTVGWLQYWRYREIWVVDDMARDDPYLQDALRLAAPVGVEVRVMGEGEAAAVMSGRGTGATPTNEFATGKGIVGWEAVLVLLREPEGVLALVEGGVSLVQVNVGNLSSRPGSVRAFKNVSLTDAHVAALDALAARGIRVFFQLTPEDVRVTWEELRQRIGR